MFQQGDLEQLIKIAAQWDKSEGVIKRAELLRSAAVTSAIFELRYAGRRLVDALLVAGGRLLDPSRSLEDQFATYLGEVAQFCLRAQHDAVDAIVCDICGKIDHMERNFGAARIQSIFPDFARLKTRIGDVKALIERSRASRDERIPIYDDIADRSIDEIIDTFRQLEQCDDVLIAGIEREDRERRFVQWMFWLSIGSLVGTLISLAVGLFPWLR